MRTIPAGNYDICIGSDALSDASGFLAGQRKSLSRCFILVDENTKKYCLGRLFSAVPDLAHATLIEIESGETNKNIEVCKHIWRALSEGGADRKTMLINLGGGVIGDIGGFCASTFKRGIRFINIPTTLLAQVDASVGGKTGIDLNSLKNEIGTFSEPQAVFIYPDFLETLDARQLNSGFAEIVKHALIADERLWKEIMHVNTADIRSLVPLITRSVEIKNGIVKSDPKEEDNRKVLNFGHTIGHAIESWSFESDEVTLLHGEAIAIGMICESYVSYRKAKLSELSLREITSFLLSSFNPAKIDSFAFNRLIELMKHDKKNEKGEINFTLISAIGKAEINRNISADIIRESLKYYYEQAGIKAMG